jgi:hypothetical protein
VFQSGMEAIAPSLSREAAASRTVSSNGGARAEAIAPPAALSGSGMRREDSLTTDDVTLTELRRDPVISAQARQLTDSIEARQGMYMSSKMLKRGWSRKGGECAPLVPTPWPHDYVLGHGTERNLSYEELDLFQWQQGYCASWFKMTFLSLWL